ncbi:MAG: BtpA/SgcQ family protein [Erysipelotrichaceae bacterium]|nr:BtpA/SgcQ family protein [Erysipelotrichaceae bacterium]
MNMKEVKLPLALVMIQPDPLPGSYLHQGDSFEAIQKRVMDEAEMIVNTGFDGFILQNMHDGPIGQTANPETIAYMTVLAKYLKDRYPDKVLGILVNWDGVASLAAAAAANADFIRVEHLYTGVAVGNVGFMQGQCREICEFKKRLGLNIPVYADAQEVNSTYVAPKPKVQTAVDVVKSAFADGLFISGSDTEESLQLIKDVKKRLPNTLTFLGGGANGDNIRELMRYYDGVSVATWIKNGDMKNPIDPKRAEIFLKEIEKAREDRKRGNL